MSPNETPNDVIREVAGDRRGTSSSFVTLRDHFAASALPPLLSFAFKHPDPSEIPDDWIALRAYGIADAMLAARSK